MCSTPLPRKRALAPTLGLRSVLSSLMGLAGAVTLGGCADLFGTQDARLPGELLGTFRVVAERSAATCGEGALGSTSRWEFELRLSRDGAKLYWDSGAAVLEGSVDDAGAFAFAAQSEVALPTRSPSAQPTEVGDFIALLAAETSDASGASGEGGCLIRRVDTAKGTLSPVEDPSSLEGELTYDFSASNAGLCAEAGAGQLFATLPCRIAYTFGASRTVEP